VDTEGVCPTWDDNPSPALQLVDGMAQTGDPQSDPELATDEAGVLVITGGEWTDTDAMGCASSTITDRWALSESGWTRQ
jgi:hypothetical protein